MSRLATVLCLVLPAALAASGHDPVQVARYFSSVNAGSVAADTDSLAAAVVRRVSQDSGAVVGVAYIDLESGDTLMHNADAIFHAASTMKVPVMIEVLRAGQEGRLPASAGILLVNRFFSLADGSPYSLSPADDSDPELYQRVGERVPVAELMRRMITRSSNLATNSLMALVGARQVTQRARELGAANISVLRGVEDQKAFDAGMNNTTSARDLAILLRAIEDERVLSPQSSAEMRSILLAQEWNSKIPAGVPAGVRVAHKTGEITGVSHDAAIVYPQGSRPYVLVVLTRGIRDSARSTALIADISRMAYAHAIGSR